MFYAQGCCATSRNGGGEGISSSLWWWLRVATPCPEHRQVLWHSCCTPGRPGLAGAAWVAACYHPKRSICHEGEGFLELKRVLKRQWGGWAHCLPAPAARLKQACSGELCAEALRLLWHREPQMGFKGHKRETEQKDTTEGLNEIVSNDPEPSSKILW